MNLPNFIARRFNRSALTYDGYAEIQYQVATYTAELVRYYIPAKYNIIDVGCGTGFLSKLLPKHRLLQIDHAQNMCIVANAQPDASVVCGNACALPIKDAMFKGYISCLCWQWISPLDPALNEMKRVLKKGGIGVIATLTEGTFQELERTFEALNLPRRMLEFLSPEIIQTAMEKAGFRIINWQHHTHTMHHSSAWDFVKGLKGIGATAPATSGRVLLLKELAEMLSYYDKHYAIDSGVAVTYQVSLWVVKHG